MRYIGLHRMTPPIGRCLRDNRLETDTGGMRKRWKSGRQTYYFTCGESTIVGTCVPNTYAGGNMVRKR